MSVSLSEARFYSVEARNGFYRQQAEYERVIADSKNATFCFDLADVILQGVGLFDGINSLDEDWRMMVYRKECPYSASLENRIHHLYVEWLETSEKVIKMYDQFAAEYAARRFDVARVSQIRKAIAEVRGILTADGHFFASEKMAALRDAAIAEHRSGECLEV
jgi:hypothetical protein